MNKDKRKLYKIKEMKRDGLSYVERGNKISEMKGRFVKNKSFDITSEPLGLQGEKVGPIITSDIKSTESVKSGVYVPKTMNTYSITYIGLIIMLLSQFGIPESDATITIKTIAIIIGAIISFWGRWRKGDINIFGIRKK